MPSGTGTGLVLLFVSTCWTTAQYLALLESLEGVFDSALTSDPIDPLGDFNTHVGNDSDTGSAGIWRNEWHFVIGLRCSAYYYYLSAWLTSIPCTLCQIVLQLFHEDSPAPA